jgi:hypothetical protein
VLMTLIDEIVSRERVQFPGRISRSMASVTGEEEDQRCQRSQEVLRGEGRGRGNLCHKEARDSLICNGNADKISM